MTTGLHDLPLKDDSVRCRRAIVDTAVAALLVALLAPVLSLIGVPAFWRGELFDADCYLRLDRVVELMGGGAWYDPVSERTDAPFGEVLHWTRPFDLLLLAGAVPLAPLLGAREAAMWWGSLLSPVLVLPTLLILRWALAPLLGRGAVFAAAALFLVQPQLVWVYIAGRPDHHSLMALCAAAVFAVLWRAGAGLAAPRHAAWAGAGAGVALWVGVESLVLAALGGGGLALLWLWRGDGLRLVAAYALALAGSLALALMIEWPPSAWLTVRYVTLSVVHVVAVALAAVVPMMAALAAPMAARRWQGSFGLRLAVLAVMVLLPAAVLAALFPEFFAGPLALHPREAQLWSPTVGEMSPLWPSDRDMALALLAQLGLPVAGCLGVLVLLLRQRARDAGVLWMALWPCVVYGVIGLLQTRWSSYAQLAAVLPLLLAGRALWRWPGRLGGMPLRSLAVAGFFTAPLTAMLLVALAVPPPTQAERPASTCDWLAVAAAIRDSHPPAPGRDVLFTHIFAGPEVLWHSGYRVVAAPYISNTGIADSIRVFAATDDATALSVLRRRQAHLLLVCDGDGEAREYRGEKIEYHPIVGLPSDPVRNLHGRLLRGAAPDWAEPLPLPGSLEGFRLYRIKTANTTP